MSNILKITNKEGTDIVSVHIGEVDPARATIVVLEALAALPQSRKPRSDKGTQRTTEPQTKP